MIYLINLKRPRLVKSTPENNKMFIKVEKRENIGNEKNYITFAPKLKLLPHLKVDLSALEEALEETLWKEKTVFKVLRSLYPIPPRDMYPIRPSRGIYSRHGATFWCYFFLHDSIDCCFLFPAVSTSTAGDGRSGQKQTEL